MKDSTTDANSFAAAIADAGKALEDAEQRSLAEYVVRRKVVLDFIEILLEKVREDSKDSAYQREDILHSFICPVRVNNVSEGILQPFQRRRPLQGVHRAVDVIKLAVDHAGRVIGLIGLGIELGQAPEGLRHRL